MVSSIVSNIFHPNRFAEWVSDEFSDLVEDVVFKVQSGDMSVVAQVVENHDAVNNTTTTAMFQTVDNDLTVEQPIEVKRRIAMERTKKATHILVTKCGFGPRELAMKNNAVNQGSFVFTGNTADYKKEKGIKSYQSPRSFATCAQLSAVNAFEAGIETMASVYGDKENKDQLLQRISLASSHTFKTNEVLGLHLQPLLTAPIVPVPASELPEGERFMAIEGPSATSTEISRRRPGNLPTQEDISGLWERSRRIPSV